MRNCSGSHHFQLSIVCALVSLWLNNYKNTRKMTKADSYKTKQQLINELVTLRRRIAEWEASEAENKEIRDQLGRSEKRAALEQFAHGIGHKLRNSLGAIKNATYFLNMALEEPEPEVKEALNILEKNVTRSEKIISGFLRKPTVKKEL